VTSDEICNEEPVRQEAAHQGGRYETPPGKGRCVTPSRPWRQGLLNEREQLTLRRSGERRGLEHALEVSLLFEPCSLTSSELGIDEYQLWADGLRLHGEVPKLAVTEEDGQAQRLEVHESAVQASHPRLNR
jgi:hypothetical protein